jgi:hydroxyacyl-ACP dehydratase HTD2-like protein with hotdog domain
MFDGKIMKCVVVALFAYIVLLGYIIYLQLSMCRTQIETFEYQPMYTEYNIYDSKNPYNLKFHSALNVSNIEERLNLYKEICKKHISDPKYYVVNLTKNSLFSSLIYVENKNTNFFQKCVVVDETESRINTSSFIQDNKRNRVLCSQGQLSVLKKEDSTLEQINEQLQYVSILNGYNSSHHEGIILICNIDIIFLNNLNITNALRIKNFSKLVLYSENASDVAVQNLNYINLLTYFNQVESKMIQSVPSLWVFEKNKTKPKTKNKM